MRTPRTDARRTDNTAEWDALDFAAQLERELATITAERDKWLERTKYLMREMFSVEDIAPLLSRHTHPDCLCFLCKVTREFKAKHAAKFPTVAGVSGDSNTRQLLPTDSGPKPQYYDPVRPRSNELGPWE